MTKISAVVNTHTMKLAIYKNPWHLMGTGVPDEG